MVLQDLNQTCDPNAQHMGRLGGPKREPYSQDEKGMQRSDVLFHFGFHSLATFLHSVFQNIQSSFDYRIVFAIFLQATPRHIVYDGYSLSPSKERSMKIALFFQRLSQNANGWRSVTQKRTGQLGNKWQVPPLSVMPPTVAAFLRGSEYSRRDGLCFIWELHEFLRRAVIVSIFNKVLDKAN